MGKFFCCCCFGLSCKCRPLLQGLLKWENWRILFITDGDTYSSLLIKTVIIEESMCAKGSNYKLYLAILIIVSQWLWWCLVKHFHSIYLWLICISHILTYHGSCIFLYIVLYLFIAHISLNLHSLMWGNCHYMGPWHITYVGIIGQLMEVSSLFPDQTWVTLPS